jgi:hypothetical protein
VDFKRELVFHAYQRRSPAGLKEKTGDRERLCSKIFERWQKGAPWKLAADANVLLICS